MYPRAHAPSLSPPSFHLSQSGVYQIVRARLITQLLFREALASPDLVWMLGRFCWMDCGAKQRELVSATAGCFYATVLPGSTLRFAAAISSSLKRASNVKILDSEAELCSQGGRPSISRKQEATRRLHVDWLRCFHSERDPINSGSGDSSNSAINSTE